MKSPLNVVGTRIAQPDAPAKAMGQAVFAGDITLPGMLIAKVLRSPYPHAKVIRINKSRARHFGDAVAAGAAVNEHVAEKALSLLDVAYEPLPFVLDAVSAIQPGAPRVTDLVENNIGKHLAYPFPEGDADKALAEADLVVSGDFSMGKQEHCTQETAACVAFVDAGGRVNVWSQCQLAHLARRELAHIFKLPVRNIRILTPFVGGSFGQRGVPAMTA